MPRTRKTDYAALAAQLRKFGYKPKFGSRKKGSGSPASKAAVVRQWEKIRLFAVSGKAAQKGAYRFKFVEANTAEKVKAMEGLNPKVRTPTGFFVRVPTNAKNYRVSFDGGVLQVNATGKRGGKRTERIYRLNPSKLAKNPRAEIERVTGLRDGKFKEGRLVVNGHDSHTFEHGDLMEFEKYVAEFFALSQDPNRDSYLKGRFHGKRISAKTFADIFHVKIITQKPSHNEPRTKKKKSRTNHKGKKSIRRR